MYRRYNRRAHHRNTENRRRSFRMQPALQITIVLLAALAIFIILSTAGK